MNTPICDFLESYAAASPVRMHMPGHKGIAEKDSHDLTEIVGADCLFVADGIIGDSEKNLSAIYGADSFYSTEGSSLSIKTALYLLTLYAKEKGRKSLILSTRNAHRAFISSAILIDFDIEWLECGSDYLSSSLTAKALEARLASGACPVAVYITSPDYLGGMVDIGAIAEVCHRHGTLLMVDNAHGAYLKFLSPSCHPIDLGADISIDSAHKTLPALTGAGYLHLNKNIDSFFQERVKDAMALFASTSPSYLILESMDRLNPYLAGNFSRDLQSMVCKIADIKQKLIDFGFTLVGDEPMKITIKTKPYGYTGEGLSDELRKNGIYAEFFDADHLTLMPSTATRDEEIDRLTSALFSIDRRPMISDAVPAFVIPECVMSPRAASLAPSVLLPIDKCVGRVLSETSVFCPPAVPIIVSGERIGEDLIPVLAYYGISALRVLKDEA